MEKVPNGAVVSAFARLVGQAEHERVVVGAILHCVARAYRLAGALGVSVGPVVVTAQDGLLTMSANHIGLTFSEMQRCADNVSVRRVDPHNAELGGLAETFAFLSGIVDSFTLTSRSARASTEPPTVWRRTRAGDTELRRCDGDGVTGTELVVDVGAPWIHDAARVRGVFQEFARFMPYPLTLASERGHARINPLPPWSPESGSARDRLPRTLAYAERVLGGRFMDTVAFHGSALSGRAFIHRKTCARPAGCVSSVRGAWLGANAVDLTPSWAFFASFVVDLEPDIANHPERAGEELSIAFCAALARLEQESPERLGAIVSAHRDRLRPTCVRQPALRVALAEQLPFATSLGWTSLAELSRCPPAGYAEDTDVARRAGPLLRALDKPIVYIRDSTDQALLEIVLSSSIAAFDPAELLNDFERLPDHECAAAASVAGVVEASLCDRGLVVSIRRFNPASVCGVLLRATSDGAAKAPPKQTSETVSTMLVLNADSPLVQGLFHVSDPGLLRKLTRSVLDQSIRLDDEAEGWASA